MKKTILHLAAAVLAVQAVSAVQIPASSYTFDKATSNGAFNYGDAGNDLNNGVLGGALSTTSAAWVGWLNKPVVNIDFDFGTEWNFNEVKVHTMQSGTANIPLPNVDVYGWNGSSWDLLSSLDTPENAANNGLHLLSLGGFGTEASKLRVALSQALDGPWTFASEIQFFGERIIPNGPGTNVPEAASTGVLLGLSALALGMIKRKR